MSINIKKKALNVKNGDRFDNFDMFFLGDVGEAVDDWFEEHPEAVTNVADNSITAAKLAPSVRESVEEVTDLKSAIGNKSSLNTDDKTNLVSAINEVNGHFLDGIEEGVADWLDDHPEATTTVQDGSLTLNKFKDGELPFLTPEMFGAKGDGITDDTVAIQNCIDSPCNHIVFTKEYAVSEVLNDNVEYKPAIILSSNKTYDFIGNAKLKMIASSNSIYTMLLVKDATNITINNPNLYGDRDSHIGSTGEWGSGIAIINSADVTINNASIYKTWGDGIYVRNVDGLYINNLYVNKCSRLGIGLGGAKNVRIDQILAVDIDRTSPKAAIDFEFDYKNETWENVVIGKIVSKGCYSALTIVPGKESESDTDTYNIDVDIDKVISNGGALIIRGFTNSLYSGKIHLGSVQVKNYNEDAVPVAIYNSNSDINITVEEISVYDSSFQNKAAVYLSGEENNGFCNIWLKNVVIDNSVLCLNCIGTSAVVGLNNRVNIRAYSPISVPYYSNLFTGNFIDFRGSDVKVNYSKRSNFNDDTKFIATEYVNDLDNDSILSVYQAFFPLRNVPIKFFGMAESKLRVYLTGDIYPAGTDRAAIFVDGYGETAEFIVDSNGDVIALKLP